MFKSKKVSKSKATKRIDTLIGRHTHITGDISFSGGLRIDGKVSGNITASSDNSAVLTLSEHGAIEGELRIPNLVINGQVNGNIYASEHIELAAKARINGNVYYHVIEMAIGAEVNGLLIRAREEGEEILNVEHEVFEDESQFHLEQKQ